MKKIICLLAFFSILASQKAFAQPTYCFSPQQVEANEGDNVCLDLKVINFTDIISTQFTITFDPGVLTYQSVSNFNPLVPGLDIADFGVTTANQGYITFIWSDGQPCQSANTGVTIADDLTLFTLCFKATGEYGFHSPVEITASPIDRITRRATAQCFDIGEYVCNSFISIGTSPLTINISSGDGFEGDVVCIDFKVEDFDNLISAQYFIFWDTTVLKYSSAMMMNLGTMGDQYNINYSPAYGMLASVWFNNNVNQGITLPDGTQILQMCFEIIGDCGESSPIWISENTNGQTVEPIEIIDAITAGSSVGVNIGLLQTEGLVSVNCFDPNSITINMDDKDVCPGENFTVDVKVDNFSQIVQLMFDLKWNPGVIELTDVTFPPQSGGPACLPFSNGVDDSDKLLGLLHMDWITQGQGCNKPNGYIVMRLHFTAIGPSGSNSTIAVVDPIFVDKFGGQPVDIGINNNNSLVSLCQLNQPTIVVESDSGNPGSQVCLDFTVQDFDDITDMGYTITWEPTIMQFASIQGLNLTNLTISDFMTSQANSIGAIGVDWSNTTGVTVPDGVSIFNVCFNLIGDPGECSPVTFEDSPWPIVINTTTPNAGNVGLNGQPGQVCILDPFILNLSLPDAFGGPFSTVCVDLTVDNFNQLTNTEYSINWNPQILSFQGVTPSGALANMNASNFDISNAADGTLSIDWAAANQVLGASVPDGTALFELCFQIIGEPGECSSLSVTDYPFGILVTSATTGNASLNISTNDGSICVGGTINLVGYNVTDVSCGANPDGAIDLTVNGGSGQYAYQWSGPGVNPTAADQVNLNVGYYIVTITDVQNPLLNIIQPFTVDYTMDATYANAGQDTTRSCGTNELTLNGSASSMAPGTTYSWVKLGLGLVIGGANTLTPQIIGSGPFELTVNGANGCIDKDTVVVGGTQTPIPHIDTLIEKISCKNDTVILDGTLSPFGFDVLWTGPAVVPGTETFLTPKVTAPGWYYLTLSNPSTNCSAMDSIEVLGDLEPPIADAGTDTTLGCSTAFVPIGGASSTGSSIMYDWIPMGAGQLCGNPQAATLNACSPGTFQLTVIDTLNGCSAMDEVVVTADTLKPTSNAGLDKTLDCAVDSVTLDGSASSVGANFSYTWWMGGTMISQGSLIINVGDPGIYELEVIDNTNNCSAFSDVEVIDAKTPPIVAASHSNEITCLLTSSTLDATGSATGANISYAWFDGAGNPVGTGLTVSVNAPDSYELVVTNSTTQCTASEIEVVANQTAPPMSEAGDDSQIDCNGPATLTGTFETSNPELLIQWVGPGLGCIQSPNSATTIVTCPGQYTFRVYDNLTGCVGEDIVTVIDNEIDPVVDAGNPSMLACLGSTLTLNGTTDASDFTATWSSNAGQPIIDPATLNASVTQPGTYTLTVLSNQNGCSASDFVVVTLSPVTIVANAGADDTIDCLTPMATLDASGSSLTGTNVLWQLLDETFVSNDVTVDVPSGTYELVISTPDGCQERDTVVVTDISETFIATATTSGNLSCTNQSVDLSGSSTSQGTDLTYIWTNQVGLIVNSSDVFSVSTDGIYTLTVTNTANNCSATASVSVTQDNSNLEAAFAQADYVDCDVEAMLIGNLPEGTSGAWSSPTGANITSPSSETASASGFDEGVNEFIWTLSLPNCPGYSSDTVSFLVNTATPNAVNDNTTLQPGTGGQITINVLENDTYTDGNFTFSLLPNTIFGVVTSTDDGEVVYTKEKCVVGKVEIPYQICDLTCPDLCDDATLTIDVLSDPEDPCGETPNGITPNGDGINDELIFDELLNTSEVYPDNEIIIFNRWGDIVYQAKPYLNNWSGKNNGGKELPHATYYYILRLNIADGLILRGDVTILK